MFSLDELAHQNATFAVPQTSIDGSANTVTSASIQAALSGKVDGTVATFLDINGTTDEQLIKGGSIRGYLTSYYTSDMELDDPSGVRQYNSDIAQLKPSEGAFENGDKTKLDGIAVGANNYSLPSTVQLKPSEGAFVNGDKTKLDGIATNANNYTLPSTVQLKPSEGAFVNGDKTKLDGIAVGAQVNPDVSSFITASSSNALTNKTFDADATGNSITNIENANIKSNAAINISKTDLETLLRAKVTTRMLVTENETDAGNNYLGGNFIAGGDNNSGQSVQAYSQKFNADADHGLSHIQITAGNNRAQSIILSTGGNTANTSSGTNSHESNIQAYDTNTSVARNLTIQKLGGSVSFGDPTQAPSAKIDEDATCTNFKINCDDNTITNIQASTVLNGDTLNATLDTLSNRITVLEGQPKILARATFSGSSNSFISNYGFSTSSSVRQSTGMYRFTLATAASAADYSVYLTVIEESGTSARDDVIAQLDKLTAPTTTQFFVHTHAQDNGLTSGVLVNQDICVLVVQ